MSLLLVVVLLLLLGWGGGLAYGIGSIIHLLLVLAVIVFLVDLINSRRPTI